MKTIQTSRSADQMVGTAAVKTPKAVDAEARVTPPKGTVLLSQIEQSLIDDKAEDIIVFDLEGRSALADYMVIASGNSHRQVGAMADHLCERMKAMGVPRVLVEGQTQCDWVLIDGGDVIAHLFRPEVRAFYDLEAIWGASPNREPPEEAENSAAP